MAKEKEFVSRRLSVLEEKLKLAGDFDVDEKGGLHFRLGSAPNIEYALLREARILEKLSIEVDEGKIRRALTIWREKLGHALRQHEEHYRDMQEVYDKWLSLPFPTRIEIPEPPQPPDCEVIDKHGYTWHVEQELLNVFDDIVKRLDKWMAFAE